MGAPFAEICSLEFMDLQSGSTADELHLLNGVLAGSPVAVAVVDTELRCVRINEAFARAAGLRPGDYSGGAGLGAIPGIGGTIGPMCRRVLDTGVPLGNVPVDGRQAASPAARRRWLASAYPVRRPGGHVLGVGVMMTDVTAERQVEEALLESQALLRATQEIASVGSWALDLRTGVITWSDELYRIVGLQPSEGPLAPDMATLMVHVDDRPRIEAANAAAIRDGADVAYQHRIVRGDGSIRTVDCHGRIVLDAGGAPIGMRGSAQDITERLEVEQALRDSESRYAHVAAQIPGVMYQLVCGADGRCGFTYVSEGARDLLGVGPDEALADADALFRHIDPDGREDLMRSRCAALESVSPMWWEGRATPRPGDDRWIQLASRPTRAEDGTITFDGLIMDVSELHRVQQSARRREREFVALAENSPDVIARFDPAGRHLYVNSAVEAATGIPREAWIGKSHAEVGLPADLAAMWRNAIQQVVATGEPAVIDFGIAAPAGPRHYECRLAPEFDAGVVESVLAIGADVTARRMLESELRQAQKMEAVGRLAGGVAHDFNNLLTVIQNYADFIAEQVGADAGVLADVREVQNAAVRAATLTRQLLAFGRQQVLQPRPLDVNKSVGEVAGMLRRVIGEDISIEMDLAGSASPVFADAGQVEQVLMNLAVNARDAMPKGGVLRFSTESVDVDAAAGAARGLEPGSYTSVVVADTGEGIDPSVLPNIFEPFYTTKAPGMGTGLGLATVYGIVQQSGGHVHVDSVVGEGSRFAIFLPQARAGGSAAVTAPVEASPVRGAERILLVEDEPSVRTVIRRQLERQGYDVTDVGNGLDALASAAASDAPIDVLLTDMVMPGMSGRELAAALLVDRPGIRVVLMSGYTNDEILRRGLMEPGQTYLEKPFTLTRLASAVRHVLDQPGSEPPERQHC